MDLETLQIVCQVLLCCFSGIYTIPMEQFYAFGEANNDNKLPMEEDISIEVPISVSFPFIGQSFSGVYVNENGVLSMNSDFKNFGADDNDLTGDGIYKILPYYSDVSTTNGGNIWYRQTTDPELLQRATSEIRTAFAWHTSFSATWMFVTTWHDVNSVDDEASKRNTFQVVLVAGGWKSFIFFLYARTEWALSGDQDIAAYGYCSGGDYNRLLPGSRSEAAMITLSEKTNVNIPGVFMFEVDNPEYNADPCPAIDLENGRVRYEDAGGFGEIVSIHCDDGFIYTATEVNFRCDSNGSWGESLPICAAEILCPLQEINNGFVTGENNYGSFITYGCEPGYTLVCGDEEMSCGIDGLWDGTVPYCISITNGSVEYNPEEGSGGMINIICDEGFNLIGEEAIACDSDGTWTDTLPVCEEITCPLPEINHGFITGENTYGSSITYGCDPGYALVCGDEVVSCGIDGLWDGIMPFCIWRGKGNVAERDFEGNVDDNEGQFCSKLRERNGDFAITNGRVEYNANDGSKGIINITCDEGFNLVGEEALVCDDTWADSLPVCEEMDCPLQEIDNGFITGENDNSSSITYSCDSGYTLVCGDEVMSCGVNGIWDGIIPHCIAITNGSVQYNVDGDSESIIDITCDEGFNLIGEETFVCDLDGAWTDSLPVCEAITNGSIEYSRDEGSAGIINITCDKGFNLIGEEVVVCDLDGAWRESLPICEEITCPLQEINHGFVTGGNTYGGAITFGCEPGCALVCGDEVMTCGLDGSWDGIIPYCIWRGKSNVAERDFEGNVDDNQGQFCSKLRENNGDFGQRPE